MSTHWWHRVVRGLAGSPRSRSANRKRLFVEPLEDRRLMATRIWDGGAVLNDRWSDKDNWAGDVVPSNGDDLIFPASIDKLDRGMNNDLPTDRTYRDLVFRGEDFKLSGNRIKVSRDIICGSTTKLGPTTLSLGIRFTGGDHRIEVDDTDLILSGRISNENAAGSLTYASTAAESVIILNGSQFNEYNQPIFAVSEGSSKLRLFLNKDSNAAAIAGAFVAQGSGVSVITASVSDIFRGQFGFGVDVSVVQGATLTLNSETVGSLTMNGGRVDWIASSDTPAGRLTLTKTLTASGGGNNIVGLTGAKIKLAADNNSPRGVEVVGDNGQLTIRASLESGILQKRGTGSLFLDPTFGGNAHGNTEVEEGKLVLLMVPGGDVIPGNVKVGTEGLTAVLQLSGSTDNDVIADTAQVFIGENGTFQFGSANGRRETIGSLGSFDGRVIVEGRARLTVAGNMVHDAGEFRIDRLRRFGLTVGGGAVSVNGLTTLVDTAAIVNAGVLGMRGGLKMTQSSLATSADGIAELGGNLTSNESLIPSTIKGTLRLLAGNHVFDVSNGGAGNELLIDALLSDQPVPLNSTASITKTGLGSVIFNGANTYKGTTTINNGNLVINGQHALNQAPVIVNAGILTGKGQVSSLQLSGEVATFSPGDGVGRLTVAGELALQARSTTTLQLVGSAAEERDVIVAGQLSLIADGDVHPTLNIKLFFTPNLGQKLRLITVTGSNINPAGKVFQSSGGQVLSEGATFQLAGLDFTISYTGGDGNDVVLTRNTGPAFVNRQITPQIIEGQTVFITGHITEPNPNDTFFLDVDWGDGSVRTYRFPPGTPRDIKVGHRYLDDPAGSNDHYRVKLRWRDQHGGANSAVLTTIVRNAAPTIGEITASLPPLVVGQPITIRGTIEDRSPQDTFKIHVRWELNGAWESIDLPAGSTSFTLKHTYAKSGQHQMTVLLIDDDLDFDIESFLLNVAAR